MANAVHAILVRLPLPLYQRLKALAQREHRSVNQQAGALIEWGLQSRREHVADQARHEGRQNDRQGHEP